MTRFRLAICVVFCLALVTAPTATAQYSDCYVCKSVHYPDGDEYWWCAEPPTLMYGAEFCEIGDDPWLYCQTWGNECCIDPW